MAVQRDGAQDLVRVGMGEAVNRHRPSVDVRFNTCARHVGRNAIGVILTGLGSVDDVVPLVSIAGRRVSRAHAMLQA